MKSSLRIINSVNNISWLVLICIYLCLSQYIPQLYAIDIETQDCIVYIQWKSRSNIDITGTTTSTSNIPNKIKTVLDYIATDYHTKLSIDITYTNYHEYKSVERTETKEIIKRGFANAKVVDLYKTGIKRGLEEGSDKRNTLETMRNRAGDISREIEDNIEELLLTEHQDETTNTNSSKRSTTTRSLLEYKGFHKKKPKQAAPHPLAEDRDRTGTNEDSNTNVIIETPRLKIYIDSDIKFSVGTKTAATFGWNLDRINQASLPLDNSWTLPAAYSSIPGSTAADLAWLYVVDTGILSTHQELSPRVSLVHNGFPGESLGCHKHATHVAGIAAGKNVGVNPRARIFDVRVLNCAGSGTLGTVLQGIMAINNHCSVNGGKGHRSIVINMSIGGGGDPNAGEGLSFGNELEIARTTCDAVIVAAAGNEHASTCGSLPAAFVNPGQGRVIATSATGINDGFASFSNFGSCTIMNAPGVGILSATNSGNNIYESLSGTSMASPIVAGVATVHNMLRPTNWNSLHPSDLFADVVYSKMITDATPNIVTTAPSGTTKRLLRITNTPIEADPINTPITPIASPSLDDSASISFISYEKIILSLFVPILTSFAILLNR